MPRSNESSQPSIYPFIPTDPESPRIRVKRVAQNRTLNQHSTNIHGHAFWELVYCEQAGGFHGIGNQRWEIQSGDLFLIAPYQLHDSQLQAQRWVVQFTPEAIAPLAEPSDLNWYWYNPPLNFYRSQISFHYLNWAENYRFRLVYQLQALNAELQLKQLGYKQAARAYLLLIVIELTRMFGQLAPANLAPRYPLLTEIFTIIENRYAENLSVADIAMAVGRSSAYLTTLSRRFTGRTVLEWITERRMAEARRLLLQTDENITAICTQIGYLDPNSFIRLFRKLHGLTPGDWRRINR